MQEPKISICIPVFNGANTIAETIESALAQTFTDYELVIVDNASTDATPDIVRRFNDSRIKYYRNDINCTCGKNLNMCRKHAKSDLLFYICADDIMDMDALKKVYEAFMLSPDIGVVVRPYYWFENNFLKPLRATKQFVVTHVVSFHDSYDKIRDVIALADQISGITFRKKYMVEDFSSDLFIEMASMVLPMLKRCKAVILQDNIIAVRVSSSGCMYASTYKKSPIMVWYKLIFDTFDDSKLTQLKAYLVNNFIANNYIGLVQIKNFGTNANLFREVVCLVRLKPSNIFNLCFWFYVLGTLFTPRIILRRLVVFYKEKINANFLKNLKPISKGVLL
jgi:glycosyltransferase involved in cell wall biosynthesis